MKTNQSFFLQTIPHLLTDIQDEIDNLTKNGSTSSGVIGSDDWRKDFLEKKKDEFAAEIMEHLAKKIKNIKAELKKFSK